jgi:hypothetical protein
MSEAVRHDDRCVGAMVNTHLANVALSLTKIKKASGH